MPNEYDFHNGIVDLQACLDALNTLWDAVDTEWSQIEFEGPKRDELNGEVIELGGSKSAAVGQLESAIEVAAQRKQACLTYREQMQQFAAGARTEPHRPWYCDPIQY